MNGEGIMNLPTNVGGANTQDGLDSFAPLIAAQQTARDMGYPRFTRELLAAGSEIDPAEVQEFLQTIRDAGLTSEDVALMRRVVEAVFGDPNNYPEVRGRLLAEGVPEDLLPEMFDLEFFTALRMAVEEAENLAQEPRPMDQGMAMEAPVGMAEGGIVGLPQLTPVARELASMGRNGDTMLAHITPQEAMMLKRMGGSGTINPYTGLPEFFLGKVFKAVGKAISSVGKAVKKFAKSTVGRAITSIALGAFLGPAAAGFLGVSSAAGVAAVSGALGGFGSSILAGDGIKNALRSGLTGAVLAGGITGITGGAQAFAARPEFSQAYADQGFLGTVKQTAKNYFGSPVDTAKQIYGAPEAAAPAGPAGPTPAGQVGPVSQVPTAASLPGQPQYQFGVQSPTAATPADIAMGRAPATSPMASAAQLPPASSVNIPADLGQGLPGGPGYQSPSLFDRAVQGTKNIYSDYLSPSRASIQPPNLLEVESQLMAKYPNALPGSIQKEAARLVAEQTPGMFAKYGPLAATGIGALALTGNLSSPFEVPEPEPGETYEQYMARRQAAVDKFRQERPEFYGSFLASSPNPGFVSTQPIMTAAKGSGPKGVENFPRKNGHISGPGTGTSDDIPAMLSDGEFVFTAKAVRNMGNGSRRRGAARMYKMMKMLEGGPVDKTAKA